jgi:hypothetical protein
MDMNTASETIRSKIAEINRRRRLQAMRVNAVSAVTVVSMVSAALVVTVRAELVQLKTLYLIAALILLLVSALLVAWSKSQPVERDGAFELDQEFSLDDRLATAHQVITEGGPESAFEVALVEDAAERIRPLKTKRVRLSRPGLFDAFALMSMAVLVCLWLLPPSVLRMPRRAEDSGSDLAAAGALLERASSEFDALTPVTTETARLAKEQAALGKALRTSPGERSEALKKLSALAERIERRHDLLKGTHADEIVALSDRRLRTALAEDKLKLASSTIASTSQENSMAPLEQTARESASRADSKKQQSTNQAKPEVAKTEHADQEARNKKEPLPADGTAQKSLRKPDADQANTENANRRASEQDEANRKQTKTSTGGSGSEARPQGESRTKEDPSGNRLSDSLSKAVGEESAKAMPKLSEALLNKALELKNGQLSANDLTKLAQAAQALSKDLSGIPHSETLGRALEEMAKQVKPEQIEQVARELAKNEELREELQAAARLLSENQQAKDLIAGLSESTKSLRERLGGSRELEALRETYQGGSVSGNRKSDGSSIDQGGPTNAVAQSGEDSRGNLEGRGVKQTPGGQVRRGEPGAYLYLETRPSTGAARSPYASAYPMYRREAERYVKKGQVPSQLRTMVRDYFDAINPDRNK